MRFRVGRSLVKTAVHHPSGANVLGRSYQGQYLVGVSPSGGCLTDRDGLRHYRVVMQDIFVISTVVFLSYWTGRSLVYLVSETQDKMARVYYPELEFIPSRIKIKLP